MHLSNTISDIKSAFDPFYTSTSLSQPTDVNVLHDIKDVLDDMGIYEKGEIENFNEQFFNAASAERLSPILDQVVSRFDEDLMEEQKVDFKIKAKQFVKIYAQLACIIPFNNAVWEMLHWFLTFLIPKLNIKDINADMIDEILNSVDLSTYGLQRVALNQPIVLDASAGELDPQNANPRSAHEKDNEKDALDQIITTFNERFFAGWDATPDEQRVKFVNIAQHVKDDPHYAEKVLNNTDEQNKHLALMEMIRDAVNRERERELDLYKKYISDDDFRKAFDENIIRILSQQDGMSPS